VNRPQRNPMQPSRATNESAGTLPAVSADAPAHLDAEHERHVLQAIRETTFGTIEVTIHQSRIVQITRSEKIRF
jgi:hypothetical protein